jgi:ABC-type glycerol-3-phosphate transport system substrate-binding protein
MKRTLSLVLTLALICTLFAACASSNNSNPTAVPTNAGATAPPADTVSTPGAAIPTDTAERTLTTQGRAYAVDDYDYPLEPFVYDLPLTTEDHVFTYFTTSFIATAIPPEGLGSMPYQTMLRDKTGVHLDYQVVALADMQQSVTLMQESDSLTDIVTWANLYWQQGSTKNMVTSGYYVNLADYRNDIPNFLYQIPRWDYNPDLIATLWLDSETILSMASFIENSMPGTGYFIRGDWADEVGIPVQSIETYDDLHNYLVAVKNKYSTPDAEVYPIEFFSTVELAAGAFFGGLDTGIVAGSLMPRVVDGVVTYTQSEDVDYEALKLFLDWCDEGLVDPGYTGYGVTTDFQSKTVNGLTACFAGNPSEITGIEQASTQAGARWDYIKFPVKTAGQQLKYGHGNPVYTYLTWGWCFSAKGHDIPVILNYADYFYSAEGSFDASYGVVGSGWDDPNATAYYDDDGAIQHTDFWTNGWKKYESMGVASSSWLMLGLYGNASFYEPGLSNHLANYAYEGGEKLVEAMYAWAAQSYVSPNPDGSNYDWPSSQAKMTDEQSAEFNSFSSDMNTWIAENYGYFLNDTTPLTEQTWDVWIDGLNTQTQFPRYKQMMQQVYDDYMKATRG